MSDSMMPVRTSLSSQRWLQNTLVINQLTFLSSMSNILFIVANENTIIMSVLATIYTDHQSIYLSLQDAVYDHSLKWAYESAWDNFSNLMKHLLTICCELIFSHNYLVIEDSLCYCCCMWHILKGHVKTTKLPLPCAIQIVLHIIMIWNRCKDGIDKITCLLDGIIFPFTNGFQMQVLVICKLKKKVIAAAFTMKHTTNSFRDWILCHPIIPPSHLCEIKGLP